MKKYEVRENLGLGNVVATFETAEDAKKYCEEKSPENDIYLYFAVEE